MIGSLLLLIYWALCIAGNPSDPYSLAGWFGTDIDKKILGEAHMYHGEGMAFDPEGIMSTLPSITEVIFGYLVGDYIRKRSKTVAAAPTDVSSSTNPLYQTLTVLFVAATALLFTAYCWNFSFPVNKKIWTSSYVVGTVGLAIIVLAMLVYSIEVKNKRGGWAKFFDVFGKNPLFIYALSGLIPKTLALIRIPNGIREDGQTAYISPWGWFYEKNLRQTTWSSRKWLFAVCYLYCLIVMGNCLVDGQKEDLYKSVKKSEVPSRKPGTILHN